MRLTSLWILMIFWFDLGCMASTGDSRDSDPSSAPIILSGAVIASDEDFLVRNMTEEAKARVCVIADPLLQIFVAAFLVNILFLIGWIFCFVCKCLRFFNSASLQANEPQVRITKQPPPQTSSEQPSRTTKSALRKPSTAPSDEARIA